MKEGSLVFISLTKREKCSNSDPCPKKVRGLQQETSGLFDLGYQGEDFDPTPDDPSAEGSPVYDHRILYMWVCVTNGRFVRDRVYLFLRL